MTAPINDQINAQLVSIPVPRAIELTNLAKLQIVLLSLMLVGFSAFSFISARSALREKDRYDSISRDGVVAQGVVQSLLQQRSGKTMHAYVTYSFVVDGQQYGGTSQISFGHYRNMRSGEALPVKYLAANPQMNQYQFVIAPVPVWIFFLMIFAPAVSALVIWNAMKRERELLENGNIVTGTVSRSWGKGVAFSYVLGGESFSGRGPRSKFGAPAVGSPVTVLYDPQNPKVSTAFPCAFYQLQ